MLWLRTPKPLYNIDKATSRADSVAKKRTTVYRAIDWKLKWCMLSGLKIPSDIFINSLFNDDVHSAAHTQT